MGVRVRVGTWTRDLGVRLLGKRRTRKDRRGDRLGAQVFPHPVPPVGLNMQALPDLGEVLMTRGRDGARVPAASLPTCRVFSATASGYTAGLGPRLTGTSNSGPGRKRTVRNGPTGRSGGRVAPSSDPDGLPWAPRLEDPTCPGHSPGEECAGMRPLGRALTPGPSRTLSWPISPGAVCTATLRNNQGGEGKWKHILG